MTKKLGMSIETACTPPVSTTGGDRRKVSQNNGLSSMRISRSDLSVTLTTQRYQHFKISQFKPQNANPPSP